jgi:hypothetical protein
MGRHEEDMSTIGLLIRVPGWSTDVVVADYLLSKQAPVRNAMGLYIQ